MVNTDVIKATDVKHNVKLTGKSGQAHQIDVYWEYEIAGVKHKVAIEYKNYNSAVSVGKVRDFYGVLSDLNNVAGIMVTKEGYQEGAKEFASHYGISLKELRTPNLGEAIIGEIELNINVSVRHRLFLVDEEWAKANNLNFQPYLNFLDSMNNLRWPPRKPNIEWANATHTRWGAIKIKEVKYAHEKDKQTTIISIDAHEFIKAILKDALSGEIRLIAKNV